MKYCKIDSITLINSKVNDYRNKIKMYVNKSKKKSYPVCEFKLVVLHATITLRWIFSK